MESNTEYPFRIERDIIDGMIVCNIITGNEISDEKIFDIFKDMTDSEKNNAIPEWARDCAVYLNGKSLMLKGERLNLANG